MDEAWIRRFAAAERTLVVTGAGVSLASGIPTFRGADPGAVWEENVVARGTWAYFLAHPLESWLWYLGRFRALRGAEPNPAHRALAEWERLQGAFLLVTQNVDGLHRAAGSEALVEVHGRADRVRCTAKGCQHAGPRGSLPRPDEALRRLERERCFDALPECPACGGLLRPHLLWFDERYDGHRDYRIDEVMRAAKRADAVLFAGTSFAVGLTELVLDAGLRRGAFMARIDPNAASPHRRVEPIAEPAEEALPELVAGLRARR